MRSAKGFSRESGSPGIAGPGVVRLRSGGDGAPPTTLVPSACETSRARIGAIPAPLSDSIQGSAHNPSDLPTDVKSAWSAGASRLRRSLSSRPLARGMPMSLHIWSLYATAVLLLCLTPGPNSLLAVTNGVRFGVGKTLFSTFGCAAGLTLLIGASLSGLGVILAASETAFTSSSGSGPAISSTSASPSFARVVGSPMRLERAVGPSHEAGPTCLDRVCGSSS